MRSCSSKMRRCRPCTLIDPCPHEDKNTQRMVPGRFLQPGSHHGQPPPCQTTSKKGGVHPMIPSAALACRSHGSQLYQRLRMAGNRIWLDGLRLKAGRRALEGLGLRVSGSRLRVLKLRVPVSASHQGRGSGVRIVRRRCSRGQKGRALSL